MLDACFNGTWSQHLTGILSNDVGLWTSELSAEHCNRDKKSWYKKMREEAKYKPDEPAYAGCSEGAFYHKIVTFCLWYIVSKFVSKTFFFKILTDFHMC
jgi:hypothetical protein